MNPSHPNSPAPLSAAPDGLESLRQGIDALDQQLVDLLARRHQLIEEVARVKHQQNLATFHPAREENLISARRAQAMAAGLNPDYIEDLFRTVLRHSRVGQLETLGRRGVRPGARVLLVGGHGSMGRFSTAGSPSPNVRCGFGPRGLTTWNP